MMFRPLAVVAVALFLPALVGCGESGGAGGSRPSTGALAERLQQSDDSLSDEEATCAADAMRDTLPASVLNEYMNAEPGEEDSMDDSFMDDLDEADGTRLIQALISCVDFGDMGDEELDFDLEDSAN